MIQREAALSESMAILTKSGALFDYLDPKPSSVRIGDVITSLSRTARYRGMGPRYYSVAEHSVLVMNIVDILWEHHLFGEARWAALMHDAAESYTGDLPKPLKRALGPAWNALEDRIEQAVWRALGVDRGYGIAEAVKRADAIAYGIERRYLYGWGDVVLPNAIESALKVGDLETPTGLSERRAYAMLLGEVHEFAVGRRLLGGSL